MRYFFIFFLFIFFSINLNALTLEQALKMALKYNPAINQTSLNISIQKKRTAQIESSQFGEIDAIAKYNKTDYPQALQPLNMRHLAKDVLSVGINYQVPLFTGFEITKSIEISKLNEKIFKIANNLTKNQVIFNIKSVYYKILSLKKQLIAMNSYKNSLNKLFQDVKLMVETGKKPEVDLYKISYDVKSVDATISSIKNNIDTLKYTLKELIGKDNLIINNIQDITLTKNFKPEKISYNKLPSLEQLSTKSKISKKNIAKTKSAYYPKLYLNADTFENYGKGDDLNIWQITLDLKFNIFDFGKTKNSVKEAILEKQKIEFEKLQTKLKKEKDIRDAINRIKTEKNNIDALKQQVKFAKESERIEKMKYEEGVSQIYDYLYAKSRRYIAESNFYDSLYKRETAIAYYDYVIEKYAK